MGRACHLFDRRPIEVGGFTLAARAAWIKRGSRGSITPATRVSWAAAMEIASSAANAAPFWMADLLIYAETRPEWAAALPALRASTGLEPAAVAALVRVARRVGEAARAVAPTFAHAAAVARLSEADQVSILTRARSGAWTVAETAAAVTETRAARRLARLSAE